MELTRRIREKMMKEHLMFVYRGVVTNDNSVALLQLLEKEMENSEFGFTGRKKLFMFVLESLQNVTRHSDKEQYGDMSLVVYSKSDNGYTVTTGNVLEAEKVGDLKGKLEQINKLDPEALRVFYRQVLSNSEFSSKGGAGLGLIEMAKKTGNRLDYDFIKLDRGFSYFVLSKTVDSIGMGVHFSGSSSSFRGKAVAQLERLMAENNVYFIWSGHFSSDVEKEVLSFTETKLTEEEADSSVRKRVFSVLIELLENVARHAPDREAEQKYGLPVAMIRLNGTEYMVTTGNLIHNDRIGALKEKLDRINSCDKEGLMELLKESLKSQSIETDSTGNLGLIEMARKSEKKIIYQLDKITKEYSYLMITVRIDERSA
jgi:ACT domain-containing protein